jgi:flagellar hook protein FlgE
MGFQQGLSGLNVSSSNLQVIGNNVANANTYGAKTARAEFADVYAKSLNGAGSVQIGIGARVATVAQQFTQGNISTTENPLDLAINGDGFFQVQRWDKDTSTGNLSESGPRMFTRNGQFKLDKDGYVVTNEGHRLLGQKQVGSLALNAKEDASPLRLGLSGGSANPTSLITAKINLAANDVPKDPVTTPFSFNNDESYSYNTSQTLYDPSGEAIAVQYYFRKTATDSWSVYAAANGTPLNTDPSTGAPMPIASINFTADGKGPSAVFDAGGNQVTGSTVTLPDILAGTSSPTQSLLTGIRLDLSGSTQFAGKSSINSLSQNGYAKGDFASFAVDTTGAILVRYTNGQTVTEGQLTIARFDNPQGLQPDGGNNWLRTEASGDEQVDTPATGKMGLVQGGALEESNVDLTSELVNMIVAQRMYQANAQTIKAEDQILQTLVNLR